MRASGVILDFYDDPTKELVKSLWPTPISLPDVVKEAHILSLAERQSLRDDAFALLLEEQGTVLRKFACVDAGNTLLSMAYFDQARELLPPEAVKVAANNIGYALEKFHLPIPQFIKEASETPNFYRVREPTQGTQPDNIQNRLNLSENFTNASEGRVSNFLEHSKVAAAMAGVELDDRPKSFSHENTVINIDGFSNSGKMVVEKSAGLRALDGRYPIDTYSDVTKAVAYFDNHLNDFTPEQRREFAVKTAAQADKFGIAMSGKMAKYASLNRAWDLDAHMIRRVEEAPEYAKPVYEMLREKQASVSPFELAEALASADRETGLDKKWGGYLQDPYLSVFGGRPEFEKRAEWSWVGATGDQTDGPRLTKLSMEGRRLLLQTFSPDVVDAFCKNPVEIFESLPDDHKRIIARLSHTNTYS